MHCLLATSLSPLSPSLLPLCSPCPLSLYNPILFSLQALRVPASWSGWRRWVRLPLGWGRGVGVWGYGRRETPPPLLLLLNLLSALPSSSSSSSMLGYPNRAHGADDTVRVHGSSSSVRASRTCPQDPPTAQLETTVRRTPRKVPSSPLAGCSRRARSAALLPEQSPTAPPAAASRAWTEIHRGSPRISVLQLVWGPRRSVMTPPPVSTNSIHPTQHTRAFILRCTHASALRAVRYIQTYRVTSVNQGDSGDYLRLFVDYLKLFVFSKIIWIVCGLFF